MGDGRCPVCVHALFRWGFPALFAGILPLPVWLMWWLRPPACSFVNAFTVVDGCATSFLVFLLYVVAGGGMLGLLADLVHFVIHFRLDRAHSGEAHDQ